jgi:hypothetical protein
MSASKSLFIALALLGSVAGVACTPAPTPTWLAAGCYNSPAPDAPDFRFSGTPNVPGNLTVAIDISTFTLSTDGTCSGLPLGEPYSFTLVRAADEAAAEVRCATLGLDSGVGQIAADYPSFPADAWVCNPPPAP